MVCRITIVFSEYKPRCCGIESEHKLSFFQLGSYSQEGHSHYVVQQLN